MNSSLPIEAIAGKRSCAIAFVSGGRASGISSSGSAPKGESRRSIAAVLLLYCPNVGIATLLPQFTARISRPVSAHSWRILAHILTSFWTSESPTSLDPPQLHPLVEPQLRHL